MKKVLLLLILGGSLLSCKKKPCWECERTEHSDQTTTTSASVCDKTEEEIKQYEKDNSTIIGNAIILTKCTKK